jgi:hypothetical protein
MHLSFRRNFLRIAEINGVRDIRGGTFDVPTRHLFLKRRRLVMDFGRGALLWLLGVPLPIILLLALFWHH